MLKLIPKTCGRYSVDITSGAVFDHYENCELVPEVTKEGRVYQGISGLSEYYPDGKILAGVLVMLAMNDLTIPLHRWCELTVDYCNGNVLDVHYRNLYWRFINGPMESEVYPGYYYVPEYKNIVVSKEAKILSYAVAGKPITSKLESESWVNYLEISAVTTSGKSRSVKIHTLVALALCHRPGDPSKLTVNHIDLEITNNYPANLEWLSSSINFLHHRLMCDIGKVNHIALIKDGVSKEYPGLKSAGEAIGVNPVDLWLSLRHDSLLADGSKVVLLSGESVGDDAMRYITDSRVDKMPTIALMVKHIGTGEITLFTTMDDAARFIGTEPSGIHHHLKQPKYKQYKGTYLIIRADDTWPTQEEIDSYVPGSGKKIVVVKNTATGEITEYDSAAEAIRVLGLSKKIVTQSLRRNNQRLINGYRFQYKPEEGDPNWVD